MIAPIDRRVQSPRTCGRCLIMPVRSLNGRHYPLMLPIKPKYDSSVCETGDVIGVRRPDGGSTAPVVERYRCTSCIRPHNGSAGLLRTPDQFGDQTSTDSASLKSSVDCHCPEVDTRLIWFLGARQFDHRNDAYRASIWIESR
jgi:hypothetical protein